VDRGAACAAPYLKIGQGPPLVMVPGLTPEHDVPRGWQRWLAAGPMVPADPTDVLVTLDAEDAFDVEADLPRVTAPTLVIGGGNDHFYTHELFQGTAAGVQDGRVHIFPGWGHVRASSSTATIHLTLGFMLAGMPSGVAPAATEDR
jgi:pimeloyl-ACP methyl ester carboxylesterase